MKKILLCLTLCLLLLLPGFSFGETQEDLVVLLIIDQSGSMLDTDPKNYRGTSAELLVDILGAEDQLGILTFSTEVKVLSDILPVGENRKNLHDALKSMEATNGDTDYLLALQKAKELLLEKKSSRCSIVFLTDGDPDPLGKAGDKEFMEGYLKQLSEVVDQLALEHCSIYTVGFGTSSDEVLAPMSSKTHGLSFVDVKPKDLAGHFFSILSSLKGRESLVEENLSAQETSYTFKLDSNTTQMNCLVLGEFTGRQPLLKSASGTSFPAQQGEGYSSIVLTKENLQRPDTWTLEIPKGASLVTVSRDTIIRLEILSPTIQSEFSEESPIDLAAVLHGSQKEYLVEARPVQGGEPKGDWIPLSLEDGLYHGGLSGVFYSGKQSVEFRVREEDSILTSLSVPVHIKRIPELHVEIRSQQGALVEKSDVVLSAWLTRNQKTLMASNVTMEEFRLVRNSPSGEVQVLDLRDDGEEGDLIQGDGIYSGRFTLENSGDLTGEVQARGLYGEEPFQVSKILQSLAIEKPGFLEIVLNGNQPSLQGAFKEVLEIPLSINNQGEYDEVVTFDAEGTGIELVNSIFTVKAKESLKTVLQLKLQDQSTTKLPLNFHFRVKNPSTKVQADGLSLELIRKASGEIRKEQMAHFFGKYGVLLFIFLLFALGYLIYRLMQKKKHEKETKQLQGYFSYKEGDSWQDVPLEGELYQIAFGKVGSEANHVLARRELGFILSLRRAPGDEKIQNSRFHVHCGLPGVITLGGVDASSFELGYDEEFFCGGYPCQIRRERS